MDSPADAAAPAPVAPPPPLPARVGALLANPTAALRELDARGGGGVRDALWLLAIGTVCLRMQELSQAFVGELALGALLRQLVTVFAQEVRPAVFLTIGAGLIVTIAAGKGRRDPGLDIELGAAAFIPLFALRALGRALTMFGALPPPVPSLVDGLSLAWMGVMVLLAVQVARARPPGGPAPAPLPPRPAQVRERVAVTLLALVLGGALIASTAEVARRGRQAPEFALRRVDDPKAPAVTLSSLRGKVVLLDFWATWCAPCVQMLPTLHDLHREFQPRGVEFVGINSDGPMTTAEDLRAFLQQRPAPYPIVVDDGQVGERYNVAALPHMVVVGRDGMIRKVFWGLTSKGELSQALADAAAQ